MDESLNTIAYKLIMGEDYRTAFNDYIEKQFLDSAIVFFKKILNAKLEDTEISEDWYKETFLNEDVHKSIIATSAGLNLKTIGNIFNSQSKEVVLDFANQHYDILKTTIDSLLKSNEFDISLKISFKKISVELNANETLVVINALSVLRSQINGGAWSSLGKRIELPLMSAFVNLLKIPRDFYFTREDVDRPKTMRETDFYFKKNGDINQPVPVEIKLMGKGNPESADGAIARDSKIFFAYQLSDQNKTNLKSRDIAFIEMCRGESVLQLQEILPNFGIEFESVNTDDKTELSRKLIFAIGKNESNSHS